MQPNTSTQPQMQPLIPQPTARQPWTQKDSASIVRDADGKPVSFVENTPHIMHCVQNHDPILRALWEATYANVVNFHLLEKITGQPVNAKHTEMLDRWCAALMANGVTPDPRVHFKTALNDTELVWG